MENLLLVASFLWYGTCWMTGPVFAADAIERCIEFKKEGYELVAMTQIGVPIDEDEIIKPRRKPLEEVVTYL